MNECSFLDSPMQVAIDRCFAWIIICMVCIIIYIMSMIVCVSVGESLTGKGMV